MIYVLSGGGTKLFAAIGVTYPEGSTCTCTNGTKTLKAKNTSGQWVFAIPETGTWTVSCTDGKESASESVEITTEGQSVKLELSYDLWLIKNGVPTDITGGFSPAGTTKDGAYVMKVAAANTEATKQFMSKANIDFSKYKTLHVTIESMTLSAYTWCSIYLGADGTNASLELDSNITTSTTKTVDISAITATTFGFFVYGRLATTTLKVSNVWCTK